MIALLGSQRFSERVRALAAVALGPAVREAERQPRERRLRVGGCGRRLVVWLLGGEPRGASSGVLTSGP